MSLDTRIYRTLWRCVHPLIRPLLMRRVHAHKEDLHRLQERFGQTSRCPLTARPLWIHGASVGESIAGLSLARWIRQHRPHLPILITSTTRTSAEYIAQRLPEHTVHQYIPLDAPEFIDQFLNFWQPKALFLIESEFWPYMLHQLHQKNIPCIALDGHLSHRSYIRWHWARRCIPNPFACLTEVYVSSPEQAVFFKDLGASNIHSMPPLKFANDPLGYDETHLKQWQQALGQRWVWLAASTHPAEEEWVIRVHQELKKSQPDSLLIWAPRHMDRLPKIRQHLDQAQFSYKNHLSDPHPSPQTDCMLVDTFGMLGLFYRLCPRAFVGGSLEPGVGGHNIIEPLQLGCLPFHGPYMDHAPHVVDICRHAGLDLQVHTPDQAIQCIQHTYQDAEARAKACTQAQTLCQHQQEQIEHVRQSLLHILTS